MRLLFLAIALTFVLGCATALAFYLVGGNVALIGPYVLGHSWPIIHPLEAALVAGILGLLGFFFARTLDRRAIVLVVLAAWIGQYFVLAVGVLADELSPVNSIGYWLMATGGPLQPTAATLGGWFGLRLRQLSRPT